MNLFAYIISLMPQDFGVVEAPDVAIVVPVNISDRRHGKTFP
jgi:hypothetical protein